jgi:hypothetical protein
MTGIVQLALEQDLGPTAAAAAAAAAVVVVVVAAVVVVGAAAVEKGAFVSDND